jgi:hypothetical protein
VTWIIDHLVYACPDLGGAVAAIAELTGVTAAAGCQHLGLGTKNALLSLGAHCHLELIGPDPGQVAYGEPRPFSLDRLESASLRGWATAPGDVNSAIRRGRIDGHDFGGPVSGNRRTREGEELHWTMTVPEESAGVGVIPFLIDWGDSAHPATSAPSGLVLEHLVVLTPEPGAVGKVLAVLGLEHTVAVEPSPSPALRAELRGLGGNPLVLVS